MTAFRTTAVPCESNSLLAAAAGAGELTPEVVCGAGAAAGVLVFGIAFVMASAPCDSCAGFSTSGGGVASVAEVAASEEVAPTTAAGVAALRSVVIGDPSMDMGGIGNWLGSGEVWNVQLAQ
jgi:hypothetical protein